MRKCKPRCHWNMSEEEFLQKANPMEIMIFVNQMHKKKIERQLEGTGVHRAQHRLLMTLSENEFGSQSELASMLEVSTATVAVSLKKLERDGYIQKEVKKDDSRVNFVRLTPKGEAVVQKSRKIFEMMEQQVIKGFSEEELVSLRKSLRRIYNNLSEIN